MATWQASSVNAGTSVGIAAVPGSVVRVVSKVLDFAELVTDITTLGTTDTIEIFRIPDNTLVLAAGIDVLEAEATNTTAQVELGDGSDPNRYVASATISSTGQMAQVEATTLHTYSAADTLDILLSVDDPTNAVLRVWAIMVDVSGRRSDTETDKDTYSA